MLYKNDGRIITASGKINEKLNCCSENRSSLRHLKRIQVTKMIKPNEAIKTNRSATIPTAGPSKLQIPPIAKKKNSIEKDTSDFWKNPFSAKNIPVPISKSPTKNCQLEYPTIGIELNP